MEFMLDTLNLDEIKKWSEILPLAGVTSNPTIAKREGSINFFRTNQRCKRIDWLYTLYSCSGDFSRF